MTTAVHHPLGTVLPVLAPLIAIAVKSLKKSPAAPS
jgi:hypothetical protein